VLIKSFNSSAHSSNVPGVESLDMAVFAGFGMTARPYTRWVRVFLGKHAGKSDSRRAARG
jgi:hypothetical protein